MCFYGKLQHLNQTLWSGTITQRTISSLPRPMHYEHSSSPFIMLFSICNNVPHKKEDNYNLIICHYLEQKAGHSGFTYATCCYKQIIRIKCKEAKQTQQFQCRYSGQRSIVVVFYLGRFRRRWLYSSCKFCRSTCTPPLWAHRLISKLASQWNQHGVSSANVGPPQEWRLVENTVYLNYPLIFHRVSWIYSSYVFH